MKIVFFGTPEFAAFSLKAILNAGYDVAAVVTMPDKIAGRGHKLIQSDVKKVALEHSLPLLQPDKLRDPEFLTQLRALHADLFVVIAFRMLPEVVWAMPPRGTFNLHASLLPRYRGAAPINRAIMNGDTQTGVTTFFLSHEIDTGNIIEAREEEIRPDDDAGTLHDRLMTLGADMTLDTLAKIQEGTVRSFPQPEGDFIPAPKIFKGDCRIRWDRPAEDVHNQIRGLSPYPAAFSRMVLEHKGDTEVKMRKTRIALEQERLEPGEIRFDKTHLYIGTATAPLEILDLQPSGKKAMAADAFLRGYVPVKIVEE